MDDDPEEGDIEMEIDVIPSQVSEVPFLYYPSMLPDAHGKWLFFERSGNDLL